jgi:acetylornithine deacetylase
MNNQISILYNEAVTFLQELIRIPSYSKEEAGTAKAIHQFLSKHCRQVYQKGNNIWVLNEYYDTKKPTLLLNSHHDTVKPTDGYTRNPLEPTIAEGKLFGLGSNDAGASLVCLMAAFLYFQKKERLSYNLIYAATAEEEISGSGGIELLLPELGMINCAIVGEPTLLQMAVAEKGLLVVDCVAQGKPGHAARNEGENAIYKALKDIEWLQNYTFENVSELLGPVKISVTMISAGSQHNIVPGSCKFTVDIRINELYTHETVLEVLQKNMASEVTPRSTRIRSSGIATDHPLVEAGFALGLTVYGSPTTSDKALMPFPALKMGPGDSARSHTVDEFVYLDEIKDGIEQYIQLISNVITPKE